MTIERVTEDNLEDLLPLMAAYQRFYEVANIDPEKNRAFFGQFAASNERGVLHLYRVDGAAVGFVTLYFSFSSTSAEPLAVLNDLYVDPAQRGKGIGRELIAFARRHAGSKGIHRLEWATALDNARAQRLYDGLDAEKTGWFHYDMPT